eukprot:12092931-Heterocapsa_arctica.AAC.1
MDSICTPCQNTSVGFNRLRVGLVNLNDSGGSIHIKGQGYNGTVTARLDRRCGSDSVIHSLVTFTAIN